MYSCTHFCFIIFLLGGLCKYKNEGDKNERNEAGNKQVQRMTGIFYVFSSLIILISQTASAVSRRASIYCICGHVLIMPEHRSIITGTTYFLGWWYRSLSIFHFVMGNLHSKTTRSRALCRMKKIAVMACVHPTSGYWMTQERKNTDSGISRLHAVNAP